MHMHYYSGRVHTFRYLMIVGNNCRTKSSYQIKYAKRSEKKDAITFILVAVKYEKNKCLAIRKHAYPFFVFNPVPTAVPPWASCSSNNY